MGLSGTAAVALVPRAGQIDPDAAGGWTGVLSLSQDQGERDRDMLLMDGTVGGAADLSRGEDRISLSFTAPVTGMVKGE
jgi:hypothetical protein